MAQFGYTAMCEQTPVGQLVGDLVAAEDAGFDFSVMSDHYFPWLEEQGHSGYAWSVLGAAAQTTRQLPLMTFVTCPTFRYHPAVIAQKAATMGVLSGDASRWASAQARISTSMSSGAPGRCHGHGTSA